MKPHIQLILDLTKLVKNASEFKYHDFKSTEATPKIALDIDLREIGKKMREGAYDNTADAEDKAAMRKELLADGSFSEADIKELFGLFGL